MRLQRPVHKSEMPSYDEETIAVCKFTEAFVPEERDAEMTMDGN